MMCPAHWVVAGVNQPPPGTNNNKRLQPSALDLDRVGEGEGGEAKQVIEVCCVCTAAVLLMVINEILISICIHTHNRLDVIWSLNDVEGTHTHAIQTQQALLFSAMCSSCRGVH